MHLVIIRPYPHCAGVFSKRKNHLHHKLLSAPVLANHMISVTSSFSKSSVFRMFSVHISFPIPPVCIVFSKSSVSDGQFQRINWDERPNHRNKGGCNVDS